MKVEKLENNKGYVLTVSPEVAGVLVSIFEKIGGSPEETPRGVTDALKQLFVNAFHGKPNSTGNPFRKFHTERAGIYFERCGIENLKKEIAEALPEMQFWKIAKKWRGGGKVFYIALPEGTEVSQDMLENIGEFTDGGKNYGYTMEAKKVDTLPKDATLLSNNLKINLF